LALESDGGMSKLLIICWIGFLCCAAIGCGRGRSGDAMEAIAGRERAIGLLQKAYDAFNRGDMAGAVAGLDPQIEWTEPDSFPGGGDSSRDCGGARVLDAVTGNWGGATQRAHYV